MTKTDLETSISNAIRSLYQLIMVVNDETLNCQLIDQNVELKNISAAGSFDSFCEDLFANIHPGDREGFRAFSDPDYFPKELKVKVYVSYECRIRHTDHHYNWSKITFCNAAKEDCAEGHDFLFLIEDIHEWKTRELKE